ncbi:hypothetical protein PF010_g27795 [Phytophthora fragariae]|uniref:Uncharacterized protein n=1 Tax=Phytophthora fragariae TaxID=53985 RepID=A0A6G0JSY2_9STRA|nr:hypothetical protein PF010_g27795 [Phytophthora fragariae]
MIKSLVMPSIASGYLSTLKYAHCSKMKKMTWMLAKRYAMAKELGTPTRPSVCVTCTASISKLRIGVYGRSESSTCKLYVGYLCRTCRIQRKLSFVASDMQLEQRKHHATALVGFPEGSTPTGTAAFNSKDGSAPEKIKTKLEQFYAAILGSLRSVTNLQILRALRSLKEVLS